MKMCQILPNSTQKICMQEEFCSDSIKSPEALQPLEQRFSICPYTELDYDLNYDEPYNVRYPCQAGIIAGRLACGLKSEDARVNNLYRKVDSTNNYYHDREIAIKPPVVRQATTMTLAVLTTATLSNLPSNPTLMAPTITATAVKSDVTAIARSAWTTSIFHSIIAILMAKASSLSTTRLLEPDLVLVIWMGLSLPFLALIFVLLVVLTWREWEIRKVEERVARDCAGLGVMPLPQWRELVRTMGTADIEKKLAMDLRLQQELQKLRGDQSDIQEREWDQNFRPLAASA